MTHTSPFRSAARRLLLALVALTASSGFTFAQEMPKKNFDVPAGEAIATLKQAARQGGVEIMFPAATVQGVKTLAVKGELTLEAVFTQMLAGTDLVVVQDDKTGALAVKRASDPNDPSRPAMTPAALEKSESGAMKLERVVVLGSRIRQTETAGPSPVSTYDSEYIKSTGSFTLADFLNQIPQTYSGISSGRGSTPNELNPEFGQRTETSSPPFNLVIGASAAPPGQTGVSGVSLRGLGSGSTLVLVDGRRATQSGSGNRSTDTRQGFVDLNTIPLGMIERVEVSTDGASAIYGADAVAGVINIILKKNYSGTELNGAFKTAEHGGGRERTASVLHGFSFGKLSGTVSLEYYDRQNLKASERSFSKNQNHTGVPRGILLPDNTVAFGRDYRLSWGYPAVVQASGGVVSGNFDAIPGVRVVLVPEGSTGTPALNQFIPVTTPVPPATVVNGSGQRRFNSAEFMDLIPESERTAVGTNFKYKFNDQLDAYATFRTSEVNAYASAQIGGNTLTGGFGAAAVLQAAFSPFNQNVSIGMMLPEWGALTQRVKTLDDVVTAGVLGKFGASWAWELGGSYQAQKHREVTRNFNSAGFAALLNNPDATKRFNPFIDYRAPGAPSQAALLETLSLYPSRLSEKEMMGVDFVADGEVFELPGGTLKMAVGGSAYRDEVDASAINFSTALVPVVTTSAASSTQDSKAVFAELSVPIFGKPNAKSFLRRVDMQLAARYEEVGPFSKTVPKIGLSWAPVQSVLLRGGWSEGFRAPGVTEYLSATTVATSTLTDPRRTPPTTTGIVVTGGSNPNPRPELSENTFLGVVFEPPFAKNLSLQVNYYDTLQTDVLQFLAPQIIVNNEALFADRVIRADATPADIALGQPGQITAVNRVFVNYGEVTNRSMDVTVEYLLPWVDYGSWRVNVTGSHTLESTRALAPGQPSVILDEDTASPPEWRLNASVLWRKGAWTASAFVWYMDGFVSNNAGNNLVANSASFVFFPTPSVAKLDLRATYEFKNGVWRGYGKGLRVGLGVNNVFDKEPPFSDTVWGFNAGLHSQLILGRAYEFSFVLPF